MPWQWGQLGLTENGGNRLIKYADAIVDGVRDSQPIPCLTTHLTVPFVSALGFPERWYDCISIRIAQSHRIADPLMVSLSRQHFLRQPDPRLERLHVSLWSTSPATSSAAAPVCVC